MTIRGNGERIVIADAPQDLPVSAIDIEDIESMTNRLFDRLESDEVDYDTTTGLIEFPFSNPLHSDLTGKKTMTRIFRDWVYLRLRETVGHEETSNLFGIIFNGLQQRTKQYLEQK